MAAESIRILQEAIQIEQQTSDLAGGDASYAYPEPGDAGAEDRIHS